MKISFSTLYLIMLFFYPILPQYIYIIGGVNTVNMLLVIWFLLFMIPMRVRIPNFFSSIPWFWIHMVLYAIMYYVEAGVLKGTTFSLGFIFVPVALISWINTKDRFVKTIDIIIQSGVVLGILGIIEQLTRYNFFQAMADSSIDFFHEIRYGLLRIMTTFGQPIAYGLFQVFIVALIIYRMNLSDSGARSKWLKIGYIVSVINVFFTVSRIPIISLVLIHLIYGMMQSKEKRRKHIFLVVVIGLIGILMCDVLNISIPLLGDLAETLQQLIGGQVEASSTTVGVGNRLQLWAWVSESMAGGLNTWIWGQGITTEFAYQVYEWQTKTSIENQYLYFLFHNGIVGLSTLVLSYISILGFAFRNERKRGKCENEVEYSFNIIVLILFAVYYLVELGVQESDMSRIYVILVALLISYNRLNKDDTKTLEIEK